MSRRVLPVLLAGLFLVVTLAVQGAQKVTVKFFTGKVETVEWMDDLIRRFNAENPGIVVEQEYQKDASNVIKIKFASGDIPDITTVYVQAYADQGKYLDLSGEEAWWSRVRPSIKELCTDLRSGKQYRIATNMTMAGLFYNKKIFAELGLKEALTWDEFKQNLLTIKKKRPDVVPMFVGGKDSWMLGHLIEFWAHGIIKQKYGTMGSRLAFLNNDAEKLAFDAPGGCIETLAKRILELKEAGLFNKDFLTATYNDQIAAFATGKAAIISQGMWALAGILDINKEMKEIGFSPYPALLPGTKPVILSAEDSAYLITAESKHKEEAKKFLSYLFRPENLKSYSEFLKSPCAFTDVNPDWGLLKDEVAKALKNGVNIGFTNEAPQGFSGDDAGRMVQDLYAGKYSTPLAFAKAYRAAWDKAWAASNK
ncbi:MAG: extracellular solute-binding protein [Alicyclobacillus sp.]|nr:extracellular solute-binding protein [Alicyclobacillus sp.]